MSSGVAQGGRILPPFFKNAIRAPGQKKYAEAEPLLLSGYEGMKQGKDRILREGKPRLKESLQRLLQLYEAKDRPVQAAEWKKKLGVFDTEKKSEPH